MSRTKTAYILPSVAALVLGLAACSSSTATPVAASDAGGDARPATADASSDARPASDGGDAGRVCSTLALPATSHGLITMDDTLGDGKGGTIVDGTYELDRGFYYSEGNDAGAPPGRMKWAMKIEGGKFEGILQIGDEAAESESGTFTTNGNKISFVANCPKGETQDLTFGVNEPDAGGSGDTELILQDADKGLQYAFIKK